MREEYQYGLFPNFDEEFFPLDLNHLRHDLYNSIPGYYTDEELAALDEEYRHSDVAVWLKGGHDWNPRHLKLLCQSIERKNDILRMEILLLQLDLYAEYAQAPQWRKRIIMDMQRKRGEQEYLEFESYVLGFDLLPDSPDDLLTEE